MAQDIVARGLAGRALGAQSTIDRALGRAAQTPLLSTSAWSGAQWGAPVGFNWDFTKYPVRWARAQNAAGAVFYSVNVNPSDLVNPAIWTGLKLHVDPVNGSDSNSGLASVFGDFTSAVKSIKKAFQIGNASGAPYSVTLKPTTSATTAYTYTEGPQNVAPTQACAIGCYGGRAVVAACRQNQSWAFHSGTVNTDAVYKWVNPSEPPNRLFDLTAAKDTYGLYPEIAQTTSIANVQATANSWFYDTSGTPTLYVRMTSGAAITTQRVRVMGSLENLNLDATGASGPSAYNADGCDLYFENIDFEGGRHGIYILSGNGLGGGYRRNIIGVNSTFRYAGGGFVGQTYFETDAISVQDTEGLIAFFRCQADAAEKDGFNFHWNRSDQASSLQYSLNVDCRGASNGGSRSSSDNGLTIHETLVGIDVGGYYPNNNGGCVHNIQTSQLLCLGTRAEASRETTTQPAFKCSDTASMWMADCIASGGTNAIYAQGGKIYERNTTLSAGARLTNGSGSALLAAW